VLESRLSEFGRTALRTITAVDGVGAPAAGSRRREPAGGGPPAFDGETAGIVTLRRVLPDWAVRLLVGTALLPALFAALDAFFRARRRGLPLGPWLGWTALAAFPLLCAYGWLRLLDAVGALAAPGSPVLPRTVPFGWAEAAVVVSAVAVAGLAAVAVQRALGGLVGTRAREDLPIGGAATAVGLTLAVLVTLIWILNPYAAALLVPAAHAWLLASDPGIRLSRAGAFALVAVGVVAPLLVVLHDASALGLGPLDVSWLAVLVAAGGHLGVLAAAALALFAACAARTGALVVARSRLPHPPTTSGTLPPVLSTRGPAGYAGTGLPGRHGIGASPMTARGLGDPERGADREPCAAPCATSPRS
jgi:hypothetical protein